MLLVVGLGNPGPRYEATRHNAGFRIAERFAARCAIDGWESRFAGRLGLGSLPARDSEVTREVAVLLPGTFMNRSGAAVSRAVTGLGVADPATDLVLAYDDVDLPFGRMRLRPGGGGGGHRGVQSVIEALGDASFARVRFGVGRPAGKRDTVEYVLEPFGMDEEDALDGLLGRAADAIEASLREGCIAAMNRFNGPPEAELA